MEHLIGQNYSFALMTTLTLLGKMWGKEGSQAVEKKDRKQNKDSNAARIEVGWGHGCIMLSHFPLPLLGFPPPVFTPFKHIGNIELTGKQCMP